MTTVQANTIERDSKLTFEFPRFFKRARTLAGTWRLKMADEEAEAMEQSLAGKSFLFPIVAANNDDKRDVKEIKPLFTSVSVDRSEEKEPHDWLYNDSYKEILVKNRPGASTEKDSPKLGNLQEQDGCNSGGTDSHSSGDDRPTKMAKLKRKHDRKEKTKKHKKHKHKRKNRDQKLKVKEEEKLMKLPSTIWIEESGLELEKAFRIHKKPDHDNRSFGGLYRLDIALHKQGPKLKCLGLKPDQVVDIEPKNKKNKKKQSPQRYWGHNNLSAPDSSLVVCPTTSTTGKASYGFSKNFSYVPLELPSGAGEVTGIGEMSVGVKQVVPDELASQTKKFNQRVREDSSDIKAWLALAELQSEHVQFGDNLTLNSLNKIGLEKHKKTSKISLEKKLAVLEQAVEKNPSSTGLIIPYMDLCVETTSSDKIADKWRDILFNEPQKTLLWKHYLMFCQSNFSTFSVSNTLAIYSKCFSTLSAIRDGVFKSHSPEDGMEVGMMEIFVQFCQFLRQTGHAEKAVAAFQALVEFNCFHPKRLEEDHTCTTTSAVSFFETFWDSDAPRFGENNACGWGSWMENNSGVNQIPVSEIFSVVDALQRKEKGAEQERVISAGMGKAATWIQLEVLREADQWQPKKTNEDNDGDDELDADDPDRVVLFQDISTALFKISQETLRFQLVSFFLAFLGVPTELCSFDPPSSFDPSSSFEPHHVKLQSLYQVLLEDDGQLSCSSDSLCGSRFSCSWAKLESKSSNAPCHCLTPERRVFIRNIFSQALDAFSGKLQAILVVHWLGFEKELLLSETNSKQRKQCYKAVRKLAKTLLKLEHYCNNLKVWMAFVEVEWAFGNMDEARRIVSSSLEQFNDLTLPNPNSNSVHYSFVRSYCEMEMGLRNPVDRTAEKIDLVNDERKNRILGTIAVLIENGTTLETVVTPSRILKLHRALQEQGSQMLTDVQKWNFEATSGGQVLTDFMICHALFQYWSLGIGAARSVLDSLLSSFALDSQSFLGSKYHEEILVFYCRLLQFHSRHGVCRVKPLRDLLLLALSTFQESPFFLHSYVTLELKSCASYSARRFFDRILPKSQTPVPWLFAVLYERRRQKAIWSATQNSLKVFQNREDTKPSTVEMLPNSGVDHRLRSLYERAILNPRARHCVALWRSYMNFEAENGNLRQAKAIFYQSLQRCAWAKVLYLHAVSISPDSLQDLHDLMEEKELRIRAPLDEIDLLLET